MILPHEANFPTSYVAAADKPLSLPNWAAVTPLVRLLAATGSGKEC